MDIKRPTLSEFKEIISSFSSDGRSEPQDDEDEEDKANPRTISPTGVEDPDEMYVLLYYGQEGGGEGQAEEEKDMAGTSEDGEHGKNKHSENEVRATGNTRDRGNLSEERERRRRTPDQDGEPSTASETPETGTLRAKNKVMPCPSQEARGRGTYSPQQIKVELTDEEVLEKELEDDSRLVEELLGAEEENETELARVEERLQETEANIGELESVENRLREMEKEHRELLKAEADTDAETLERAAMAREIRELKREVENLRNSLSIYQCQNIGPYLGEGAADLEESLAVGLFAKLVYENQTLVEYYADLKRQVNMANEMLVDLMSAHFSENEISKHSELWLEHRLGRAVVQNPEYEGIFRQLNVGPGPIDEEYKETESEIELYESDNFCITLGRLIRGVLDNEEYRQYTEALKRREAACEGGDDFSLENQLGERLLQNEEIREIYEELKLLAEGQPDGDSVEEFVEDVAGTEDRRRLIKAERCEEIEREIDDKLETDPDIERKAELLMLKKRIIELKGPTSLPKPGGRRQSGEDTESEEDTTEVEDVVAFLEDEARSEDARELWHMVEQRWKTIERDKASMTEVKRELDHTMALLRRMERDICERTPAEETHEELNAVRAKMKEVEREGHRLTEEYMKLDGEKMRLDAVIKRIEQSEQVTNQLTEASKSIEKAKVLVRRISTMADREEQEKEEKESGSSKAEVMMRKLATDHRRRSSLQRAPHAKHGAPTEEDTGPGAAATPATGYTAPLFISITAATALALFKMMRS